MWTTAACPEYIGIHILVYFSSIFLVGMALCSCAFEHYRGVFQRSLLGWRANQRQCYEVVELISVGGQACVRGIWVSALSSIFAQSRYWKTCPFYGIARYSVSAFRASYVWLLMRIQFVTETKHPLKLCVCISEIRFHFNQYLQAMSASELDG